QRGQVGRRRERLLGRRDGGVERGGIVRGDTACPVPARDGVLAGRAVGGGVVVGCRVVGCRVVGCRVVGCRVVGGRVELRRDVSGAVGHQTREPSTAVGGPRILR